MAYSKKTPRPLTIEESREEFLIKLWKLIDYWEKNGKSTRDCLEGLTHSFLATIDGESLDIPPMKLIPIVPKGDRLNHLNNGENWFPRDDIGGGLNDLMFKIGRENGFVK